MLRIGIIGCGKIADGHVEQIRAIERGELVAVCDQEPLMAQQLGVRMNVSARYTELTGMLDEARLDVLHIATPPASHVT
ncbi:MAG: Gfo/Idh/MocA family oxidoreductase, partial [Rhodanobacteraceae bacterium]